MYSFKNVCTINTFSRDIYISTITLKEADKDKSRLLVEIMNFKSKIKPQNPIMIIIKIKIKKDRKTISLKTYMNFLMAEKDFLMLLKAQYLQ